MVRTSILLLLALHFPARPSPSGKLDPAFERIPFTQWLTEPNQPHFHWTAKVSRAELSFHQRLIAQVEIQLDGRDLDSRRSDGQLVFFVQITDAIGARYQDHSSIPLDKLDANIKAATIQSSQRAFFLPGDYRLAVVILDTNTGEHSTNRTQFRVTSPQHDWLPGAWSNLPAVEFISTQESPDSWFKPDIQGRLEWASSIHAPARLNILVNVAPSSAAVESNQTPSCGLPALVPTLKAISQTGSPSISERVKVLDLARRRAVFEQDDVQDLDWPHLKTSLGEANTASIDVGSLSERHHEAQFFVSQVRKLAVSSARASESPQEPCVVVVLTTPIAFESGEDLSPISLEGLLACRVAYVRYRAPEESVRPFGPPMGGMRGRGSRMGGPMIRTQRPSGVVDQLEATLKPLNPTVFDVETPEQMARAMANLEKWLVSSQRETSHL